MALADTARLIASLELQDKFSGPAKNAERSLGSLDKKMSTLGDSGRRLGAGLGRAVGTIAKIGAGVAAGGIALLAVNVKAGVDALAELETEVVQTQTVIKSTGGVAGQSAADIRKLSEDFENLNASMDDVAIQGGANMLLTFTNIREDAFKPALQAVLDINQAMGGGPGGLQKTAIQVGKALNDPTKGITALTRIGVTFTKQQKDQIKALQESGDLLGAQTVILDELSKEFGGQFAAAGQTAEGRMAKLGDTIQDLQKRLAGPLLPAIDRVREKLIAILNTDRAGQAAQKIGEAIASIFTQPNIDAASEKIGGLLDKISSIDTSKLEEGSGLIGRFSDSLAGIKSDGTLSDIGSTIKGIAEQVAKLPWQSIADAARLLGTGSKALLDAFLGLPPWVQTAVLTGWGLNKLTGGALGSIVGELAKGLIKGVLGINAGVVNVYGKAVAGPGGGVPTPTSGSGKFNPLSLLPKLLVIPAALEAGANLAGGTGPIEAFLTPDKDNRVTDKDAGERLDRVDASIADVDARLAEAQTSNVTNRQAVVAALNAEKNELLRTRSAIVERQRDTTSAMRENISTARRGFTDNGAKIARLHGGIDGVRAPVRAGNATLAQIRAKRTSVTVNTQVNVTATLSASQLVSQGDGLLEDDERRGARRVTLRLEINGVDFTAKWHPYESHWSNRAYRGESAAETLLVIDDDDSTINHLNLATYKRVEIWEDASGSDVCLFRGRVTNKTLGRGPKRDGIALRWQVSCGDANFELRGIRVTDSNRPVESDRERVLAILAGYLNGASSTNAHARDSTDIDGTYVIAADLIDLPAESYRDTFPDEVIRSITELSAKAWFVITADDGTHQLYYASHTDTSYVSDISISDSTAADGVDVYAPDLSESSGQHDGLEVITGGSVRYAGDAFYEGSDLAGGEAFHDKWEEHFTDDFLNTPGDALGFLTNMVASRSNEEFVYTSAFDMRAEDVHRIKAGMITSIRIASANEPSAIDKRAVQVSYQPQYPDADGEAYYKVTVDFGFPRGRPFRRHVRVKQPTAPAQPVPDACTRLYFSASATLAGFDPSASAVWDIDSAGTASFENNRMTTSPDTTYTGGGSGVTSSAGGSSNDVRLMEHAYILGAATAAIIEAGGGTVRAQIKARSRYGVGISEAAQDNISQIVIRIYDSGGTPRGFAYTGHSLSSSAGSTKWVAASLHRNSTFPPAAADNTLDAVSGCVAGDVMVVELGYRSFTVGTTGAAMLPMSNSGFDLPEDDLTTSNYNSWLEICSGGSSGSSPEPIGGSGEGSAGTSGTYAPLDHIHPHGLLDPDGVHMHAEFQVSQMHTNSGSDPTVTDDADAGYSRGWTWNNTTSGDVFFLRDSTAGAADWLLLAPESSGLTDHDHTGGGDGGDLDAPVIDGYAVFNEESAPSTPSSGQAVIYVKSDGRFYSKGDDGVERGPFDAAGSGGGNIIGPPSGFPYIAAGATTELTVNQTSHTINLPSGIVSGSLLLLFVLVDGGTTITATGFTSVCTGTSGTDVSLEVLYKFASGSEGATMSITSSASEKVSCYAARIADHHASTPPEGAGTGSGSASVNSNPPSLTPSWGADDDLWVAMGCHDSSNPGAGFVHVGVPLLWTYLWHHAAAAADDGIVTLGYRYLNATSEDPLSFVAPSGEQWAAATVAVRPL